VSNNKIILIQIKKYGNKNKSVRLAHNWNDGTMEKSKAKPKRPIKLRKRAAELLNQNSAAIKKIPPRDVRNLIEDLQIYQIELEKYNNELQKAHENLQESEKRFRGFLDNLCDVAYEADSSGNVTYANKMAETITSVPLKEIIGKPFLLLFTKKSQKTAIEVYQKTLNGESPEYDLTFTNGRICHFKNKPLWNKDGKIIGVFGIARDITERKHEERTLQKAHAELEQRVKERTRELEVETKNLEKVNAALEILLKKRDEDRIELEKRVLFNVKELVVPSLEKLKRSRLDKKQKVYTTILESNLNEIISPFSRRLSFKYLNLTPSELQVANLVKQGKSTKEIAELFNLSGKTIESYRKNIRSKLGIRNKKINLRTHLLSIQ
jgi:PAS domain S-box-containing protein